MHLDVIGKLTCNQYAVTLKGGTQRLWGPSEGKSVHG